MHIHSAFLTAWILFSGVLGIADGQAQNSKETEIDKTIRVQVEMVSLPVVVTDREGNYIKNLKPNDFSVLEDGVPQEIAAFAAVEEPISVALMLDVSGSTAADLKRIQDEVTWFVSDLRRDDSIAILSVADEVRLLEQFSIYHIKDASKIRQVRSGGLSAVYDGVQFALQRVLQIEPGRKALVFFSDGVDNRSNATRTETLKLARQSDAPIYCIYFNTSQERYKQTPRLPGIVTFPPTRMPPEYAAGFEYMSNLSAYSGGLLFNASKMQNLGSAFKKIVEELSSEYSIGYYPKNSACDGKYREVEVKLYQHGMNVRTKPGYYHK
jgi:Ca-activated chloride channel family protein